MRQARGGGRAPTICRALDELERRGRANGVQGLARLGPDELRDDRAARPRPVRRCTRRHTGMVDFARGRRGLRGRRRGARRRDPPRRRRATRWSSARTAWRRSRPRPVRGAPRGRLRGRVVGPARAGLGRAARRAHRAVPRRLPERSAGARAPRARPDLPGPRPGAAVPRRPSVANRRRRRARRTRRRCWCRAPARPARAAAWPGTWRVMRRWWRTGLTEIAHAAAGGCCCARRRASCRRSSDVGPGPHGYRAQAVARDGGARRRLPARPHRPRRARAQRAVPRGHGFARDRRGDRERGDVS